MDINCNSTTCVIALDLVTYSDEKKVLYLYQSIRDKNLHYTEHLLENFGNVNVPLIKEGWFAGYTALHVACMSDNLAAVELLCREYQANVDLAADDGVQPIHLASFLGHLDIVEILIEENANVDSKFEKNICLKWGEARNWFDDFGPKMTLLAYAVANDLNDLAILLMNNGANLKIKNELDKTLLMYAIENDNYFLAVRMIRKLSDPEFINARDHENIPAIHYLLHKKKYKDFQYDPEQCLIEVEKASTLKHLMSAGADIDVLINNDPDTLLINVAAYRGSFLMVDLLLPYHCSKENCKALYNATLLVEVQKRVRIDYKMPYHYDPLEAVQKCRDASIKYILKNILQRCSLGAYVPNHEKEFMEKYISIDPRVKQFVDNYKKQFIDGVLKKRIIEYGEKKITFHEFAVKVFKNRSLKVLARDKDLVNSFEVIKCNRHFQHLKVMIAIRIAEAFKRIQLLERLKKVSQLRACIPLPFECVLEMIEFLSNSDLEKFIDTF